MPSRRAEFAQAARVGALPAADDECDLDLPRHADRRVLKFVRRVADGVEGAYLDGDLADFRDDGGEIGAVLRGLADDPYLFADG